MLKTLFPLSRSLFSPFFPRVINFNCKMSTSATTPIIRKFISVEDSDISSRSKPDGFRFHVVSYNILAQVYVKSSLFPHSPAPCLRWKARSKAILSVLKNLGADFLCLQEVDEYDGFYKENMESHGYSSIYVQRCGQKRDGCGIFYKPNVADFILEEKIEYNDLVNSLQNNTDLSGDKDDIVPVSGNTNVVLLKGVKVGELKKKKDKKGRKKSVARMAVKNDPCVRLKRDCVGIMAAFRLMDPSHHIVIVANTHLYWDPAWADVKLAQAKYLLSRLAQFKTLVSDKFECSPSVIVTGDFNSIPGDKVYNYLTSGQSSSVPELECLDELPMSLCSVYASQRGEPTFTNCTPDFTNTLDYIFLSPASDIKPISLLELPERNSSDVVGGLPNYQHPSDHLPIGAEFEVINT